MYYGSAHEMDMDFSQFAIMFRSIFMEGFSRPREGVRTIINSLTNKFTSQGGETRYGAGVLEILHQNGKAHGVKLKNGEILEADLLLSSAGALETHQLINYEVSQPTPPPEAGRMSFIEVIFMLDKSPAELGFTPTIIFFNQSNKFLYKEPTELVNYESGVLCCPNNFRYEVPLEEGMLRVTHMANFSRWEELSKEEYLAQKAQLLQTVTKFIEEKIPGITSHIRATDVFTPLTVKRYTSHVNGAVYGSPDKFRDGRTQLDNLKLIGTDQGFLGIIGAMLSGVSMANLHGLMAKQ
jgi:phytoene dehydrogenase-like protein